MSSKPHQTPDQQQQQIAELREQLHYTEGQLKRAQQAARQLEDRWNAARDPLTIRARWAASPIR